MTDAPSRGGVTGTPISTWQSPYQVTVSYGAPNAGIVRNTGADWFSPLNPMSPIAPPEVAGRQWDFPPGFNLWTTPRINEPIGFETLQALADTSRGGFDVLRTVIETRKDQIAKMKWSIRTKDEQASTGAVLKQSARATAAEKFFKKPDGIHSWADWIRMLLEDLFVIDAPTLYVHRTFGGDILALFPLDGAKIKPVIDDWGRRPLPYVDEAGEEITPVAYQHVLHGFPAVNYTVDDIIYRPRNVRNAKAYGMCFGPGTEILTRSGWKSVSAVQYEDQLATRHPVTHEFQWQSPILLSHRHFDGDLVQFYNGRNSIDVLVTPEHKMIVHSEYHSMEMLLTAEDLASKPTDPGRWKIPLAADSWNGVRIVEKAFANWATIARNESIRELRQAGVSYSHIAMEVGCSIATVADVATERYAYDGRGAFKIDRLSGNDFCAFMGMYLSEGSTSKGRIVIISQTKSDIAEKFRRKLAECFGVIEYDGRDFKIHRTRLFEYVSQFGKCFEKFIPDDIMNATSDQIEIFLEYLFDGDAHRSKKGQTFFYTTSQKMADQVQELCQKIGRPASVTAIEPRGSVMADGREIKVENCRRQYRVSVNRIKFSMVRSSRVPYSGDVHCVSVTNKSVLVRRNGRAAWTSQSPVEQILTTVSIALRRQLFLLDYYMEGNIPDAICGLPETWTPDQIRSYQTWWDSYFEGNLAKRRRMKFVPGTASKNYTPTKEPELKNEFDEWLIKIICYAFSVSPQPFIKQMNRSSSQTQKQISQEEGLEPIKLWVKTLIDEILVQEFGADDLEFAWAEGDDLDPAVQATILSTLTSKGILRINEARVKLGLDPDKNPAADMLMVMTATGYVLLEANTIEGQQATIDAFGEAAGPAGAPPVPGGGGQARKPAQQPAPRGKSSRPDKTKSGNDRPEKLAGTRFHQENSEAGIVEKRLQPFRRQVRKFESPIALSQSGTLYVSRVLLNASDLIEWAKGVGFETTLPEDDMHVTIAFSRDEVDWDAIYRENSTHLMCAGGIRTLQRFGDAVVLGFSNNDLVRRHDEFGDAGASWDHDGYQPHVTISWNAEDIDIESIEPFEGLLHFGPEVWASIEEDWADDIVERMQKDLVDA